MPHCLFDLNLLGFSIIEYFLNVNTIIENILNCGVVCLNTSVYDNIKKLCGEKGMTISGLESAAKLSNGAISKWKNKIPQADNLFSVSKVLNTSMELLLTGEEAASSENRIDSSIGEQERMLLECFQELDKYEKQIVLGRISEFVYQKKIKENPKGPSSDVLFDLFADCDRKDPVISKKQD